MRSTTRPAAANRPRGVAYPSARRPARGPARGAPAAALAPILAALALAPHAALAQAPDAAPIETRIDVTRPDAPELASYGPHAVGVRTVEVVDEGRLDVLAVDAEAPLPEPLPTADRALTLEVFYPAAEGSEGDTALRALMRDGETEVTLRGRAVRDAEPDAEGGPYPLVVVSHGYPGNRFLMAHLAENLASRGYVAASVDHPDSTYDDFGPFGSTLVNRPLDQLFVVGAMAELSEGDGFLSGMVDAERTGIVGYSMGGYGAVIAAGAGVTPEGIAFAEERGAPHGLLSVHEAGSEGFADLFDPRLKAVVAFAPWGRARGFWDAEGLAELRVPTLFVVGSQDDVSGYEDGVRLIWEEATGAERALLTFEGAMHNAGAPYPAPPESYAYDEGLGFAPFEHYADPVWDTVRLGDVAQHFTTAWLDRHLKGDEAMAPYLDLVPVSDEGVFSEAEGGGFAEDHTHWTGFPDRTAKAMRLETRAAGK